MEINFDTIVYIGGAAYENEIPLDIRASIYDADDLLGQYAQAFIDDVRAAKDIILKNEDGSYIFFPKGCDLYHLYNDAQKERMANIILEGVRG